jgi:cell wall-active antibiotic response 4TMS protein YvqF
MDESKEPFVGMIAGRRGARRQVWGLVVPRAVFGLILVLMGVLLTLGNMGLLEIDSIWHFWPLSLVGIGVAKVIQPRGVPGRGFGLVLLAAGVWLQLSYLGFLPFRARYFWPAVLIVLGGTMIWRGVAGARVPPPENDVWVGVGPNAVRVPVGETPRAQESSANSPVNVVAVLGGVEHRNSSQDFKGGSVSAILGGCDIDLRKAVITGDQATLDVFAFWGGIEIKVPEEWTVNVKGVPVLGAFNDRTHPPRDVPAKTLVITGAAIMGGVEIKN